MLSLAQAMAVLAFTGAVVATPLPQDGDATDSGTFSLNPIPDSEVAVSALESLVMVRRRHGVDVHPDLMEAARQDIRKRSANLIARKLTQKVTGSAYGWAEDQWDSQYLYPVKIAGKTVRASIGTAAADFWVYSSLQPKEQLKGHNYYEVNPAHLKVGSNYSIGYNGATSDSEGLVYTEEVTIGGITGKQTFGAAQNVSDVFLSDKNVDCMIGLGFSDWNNIMPEVEPNFFETIKPQLAKPVFAVAEKKGGAVFDFGFFDPKKMTGPVAWANNKWEEYWPAYRFFGEGFSLGDSKVTSRTMNIHLDTSTTLSYTDFDVVKDFYSRIPGSYYDPVQQFSTLPCNSKPPNWTVVISGQKFTTPGSQLISQPIDDTGKTCLGGLQNIGGGVDFSLFGVNFFKGKYIMHDFANPNSIRLGFAMQPGAK